MLKFVLIIANELRKFLILNFKINSRNNRFNLELMFGYFYFKNFVHMRNKSYQTDN